MQKNKLSIIIPCYNSERTLQDAVLSCFRQNLDFFEIIIVDDCSTDSTKKIAESLAHKYPEIKLFSNTKNLGGGATRNRAVSESTGNLIFCLDSDDLLADNSLNKMKSLIEDKKCDGVVYSKSIKFNGTSTSDISHTDDFSKFKDAIPVSSLFETVCPLYTVFLFTREAFDIIGGYPTSHGFDTQGFGFRFIFNNLKAYVCPDTTYYHRVNFTNSYYLREYESGKINHNWYKILEEFLYMFDENISKIILSCDLNKTNYFLFNQIKTKDKILREDFKKYLHTYSNKMYVAFADLTNKYDLYWLGQYYFKKAEYYQSFKYLEKVITSFPQNGYLNYYLDECSKMIGTKYDKINHGAIKKLRNFKKYGKSASLLTKLIRKIIY